MNVLSPRGFWIAILTLALPSLVLSWTELRADASYWYGWLPAVAMLVGAAVAVQRWDHKWLHPQGWMACTLLTIAGAALFVGALFTLPALASAAFPIVALAFLITQREKAVACNSVDPNATRGGAAKSLAYCAAPLVLLVLIPRPTLGWISGRSSVLVSSMISGWLAILEIPSATIGQTIVLFDSAVETQNLVNDPISWPLLLAIALSYSAWGRLPILGCFFNTLLAWSLAVLMLAGSSVTVAYWENNYGRMHSGSVIAIHIAWLLFACMVFASLQRISHALTAPISSRFMSSQANPLVSSWNLLAGRGRLARRSTPHAGNWAFTLIAGGTLLAGAIVQAANLPSQPQAAAMAVAIDQDNLSQLVGRPVYLEQRLSSAFGNDTLTIQRATVLHPTTPLSLTLFVGVLDSEAAIREVLPGVGEIEKADAKAAIECFKAVVPGKQTLAFVIHGYLDDEGKVINKASDLGLASHRMSAQLLVYSVGDDAPDWDRMCEWFTKLVDGAVLRVEPRNEPEE